MASERNPEGPVARQSALTAPRPDRQFTYDDFDLSGRSNGSIWMTSLCPCSNCQTCCQGYFCPCMLYGKIEWRLERLRQGLDPLDSSWTSADRCSSTCCGCYVLSIVVPFFAACAISIQQNRIRQMYDINGRPFTDFLLSVVCPWAVNMRNDKEIRAREGDTSVRRRSKYNEKYQGPSNVAASQPIQSPPPRIEPMRYVSPRETSEHTASNHSFGPPSYVQDHQAIHGAGNMEPQKPRLAFLKPQKHRKGGGADSQLETKSNSTISAVKGLPSISQELNLRGQLTHSVNNQMEHPVENPNLYTSDLGTQNLEAISPCVPFDSAAKRAGVFSHTTGVPDTDSTQSSLIDSETRDIATSLRGKRSNIGGVGGQELSYVHDFTDCPVNKSVLMYYEKEESKSTKPSPQVDNDISIKLSSNNPYQNVLDGCQSDLAINPAVKAKNSIPSEHSEFSDRVSSYQKSTSRSKWTSNLDKESGHNQGSSSRPPAARSAEEFEPVALPYDVTPRADQKATSF